MRRSGLLRISLAAVLAAICAPVAAAADGLEVAPVTRLPFPERGYVVRMPEAAGLDGSMIEVRENGSRVEGVRVTPLARSGLRYGVVLAVDASESMKGEPFAAALAAAEAFVGHRRPGEELGFVAFNGDVTVVRAPTQNEAALARALANPPELAYGTRIYDAVERSLALLRQARISAGSIVLLSDGTDIGSVSNLDDVVAAAQRERVRVFTVGLRSGTFEPDALSSLADATGGAYAEASSAAELEAIFVELGSRLSSEYLVRYRSNARPESHVEVDVAVTGVGDAAVDYVAPTPSRVAPYHRSVFSRFVLSPASVAAVGLLVAALVAWALVLLARGPKRNLVERVAQFSSGIHRALADPDPVTARGALTATRYTRGWWARLQHDLEIARLDVTPRQVAAATGAVTLVLAVVLGFFSLVLALLGLVAPPLVARAVVQWKLRRLRDDFADQLPAALQVLASALRAGHSFSGALNVVVDNTREPAHSELRRVAQDDQLGVSPEVAIRRIAERMANRDLEQVALLAELQRTSGGNSAEVLDTVVETIRQRAELRRLVRSLTAQGRMARWILTALPVVLALFLWFMQPEIMGSFFASGSGQVALLVAVVMVATGSAVIQRIVDIDV
jgi:tight adherence protein B